MSELPSGWAVEPLVDLLQSLRDGTHTPPKRTPQGVPLLSARNIQDGDIDLGEAYSFISEEHYVAIQRTNPITKGDVLLTIVGSIGRSCVNRTSDRFTVQRSVAIARPQPKAIDADYLSLLFRAPQFQAKLESLASGTAQRGVYLGSLKTILIPLAPLSEQRRIVAKLGKLISRVDAAQARLATISHILKRFRQSVLAAACSGRLTADWRQSKTQVPSEKVDVPADAPEIPESWQWTTLSAISQVKGGVTKGRQLNGRKTIWLPYLRVANVQDGYLDLSEIKQIEVLPEDKEKYALKGADLLFTEGGDRDKLGRGTVWRNEVAHCIHQNHIFRARIVVKNVDADYISIASKSDFSREYFFSNSSQTVNLASINLRMLSGLPLPLPPLEEQQEIVRRVEALFKTADALEARYREAKAHVDKLTQSILAKAFRGELVPQDPNDESVSILLDRIRRAAAAAVLPGRQERKRASRRRGN